MNNEVNKKEYKELRPFKIWALENFPFIESDFDSLTTYDLLCKIVEYLNNVINNQNQVQDLSNELVDAYNTLLEYVNNYFDNLDVQEEINNKLDKMAEDGTLTTLIGTYVQPLLTAFETEVRGDIADLETEIDAVASGSPAGVYATVDALTTADPNHSKIYLVSADGKWYYHNGTAWTAGGVYQGTSVQDNSVTINALGNDVKFNLNQRINNKDIYNFNGETKIDLTGNIINATINTTTGVIETRSDDIYFCTKNFYNIPLNANIYVPKHPTTWRLLIYFYDEDFSFIKYRDISSTTNVSMNIINNIKNAKYFRLRFNLQNLNTTDITSIVNEFNNVVLDMNYNNLKTTKGTNMVNPYKYYVGYLGTIESFPYQVQQQENSQYRTTYPIFVEANKPYYISRFRQLIFLNNNLEYISNSLINADTENYTFTPASDGYVVFSYNISYANSLIMAQSNTAVSYVPYKEFLPNYIDLSNVLYSDSQDILYNKKWVALGDSFTHGDFSNSPTSDYTITEGIYTGEYKVYPYLIGNRLNMNITNLAQNGMTITNVNGTSNNYLNDDILEQIPEDVNYITIKIGINDNPDHQNAPLGTITSSDRTTFYGAWNYVMNYLITNYPNAKIGIIVSNGMTSLDFINAELEIAKRYGVAFINETTDINVPLLIRTMRTDVLPSIKAIRDNNWEVLPTVNAHPNAKCHEYESNIIENFLRRL